MSACFMPFLTGPKRARRVSQSKVKPSVDGIFVEKVLWFSWRPLPPEGISEVKTHAQVLTLRLGDDNMAVVFSCSATGRPAPTVQWSFSPGASRVDQQPTTTAWNSDNTSTSSSNITLRVSPRWDGHVECVVNAETRGHRVERVPFSLPAGAEEDEEGTHACPLGFLCGGGSSDT